MISKILTLLFVHATFVLAACGTDTPSSTTDMGLGDSGASDMGVDLATADSGAGSDASIDTDASVTTDASVETDAGGGSFLTETSCDGLTPITTIHSSLAGGYVPQNIAVNVGDVVKWVNDDGAIDHTVWSTNFAPSLNAGSNFCLTFTEVGTYDYHCYYHPSMTGSVQVNP